MRLKLAAAVVLAVGVGGCYVVATDRGLVVGVALTPVYEVIPGTGIRVVTNAPGDVFHYGGYYYRWHNGYWWRSVAWNTGWVRVRVVPPAFLRIPATHPRYHIVAHHPLRPPHPVHPAHPGTPAVKPKPAVPVPAPAVKPPRPVPPPKVEQPRSAPPPKTERPGRPPKEKEKEKEKGGKGGR